LSETSKLKDFESYGQAGKFVIFERIMISVHHKSILIKVQRDANYAV